MKLELADIKTPEGEDFCLITFDDEAGNRHDLRISADVAVNLMVYLSLAVRTLDERKGMGVRNLPVRAIQPLASLSDDNISLDMRFAECGFLTVEMPAPSASILAGQILEIVGGRRPRLN